MSCCIILPKIARGWKKKRQSAVRDLLGDLGVPKNDALPTWHTGRLDRYGKVRIPFTIAIPVSPSSPTTIPKTDPNATELS